MTRTPAQEFAAKCDAEDAARLNARRVESAKRDRIARRQAIAGRFGAMIERIVAPVMIGLMTVAMGGALAISAHAWAINLH